ncbi:tyrosine-type recombinase/integrase [Peribacillus simplex]|uniref:tyrosine-type recombinase/integrase n=1 Tax=Peribacillus simplex TaxID=1478 RepID=UPI0024C1578D|nr:tyrosine-type recombinase/integrase [Peribacillus simplex]WHY58371.1 tyrosine-type recombinase/integrase [Peribacillus simplex]
MKRPPFSQIYHFSHKKKYTLCCKKIRLRCCRRRRPALYDQYRRAYSPSYLSQYITKAIKESGLPFLMFRSSSIGPHILRHAFSIISHLNGVDVYQIMKSLGHVQLSTTEIYLEKVFEKVRHAIHLWKSDVFGEYI